jgi:hypothetical protein
VLARGTGTAAGGGSKSAGTAGTAGKASEPKSAGAAASATAAAGSAVSASAASSLGFTVKQAAALLASLAKPATAAEAEATLKSVTDFFVRGGAQRAGEVGAALRELGVLPVLVRLLGGEDAECYPPRVRTGQVVLLAIMTVARSVEGQPANAELLMRCGALRVLSGLLVPGQGAKGAVELPAAAHAMAAAALGAIANASRLSTGEQAQTAVRELLRLDAAPALLALLAAQTQGGGGDASIDHILGQMQSSSTLLELFDVVPELDHTAAAPGRRARGAKPSAAAAPPADVSPEAQQLAAVLLQPEHSEVLLAALQRAAARAPPPTVAATPAAPPTGDLRAMQAQKQMQRLAERTVLAPLCLFAR